MTPERIEHLKQACESSRMAILNEMIVDREELEWLIEQAEAFKWANAAIITASEFAAKLEKQTKGESNGDAA